MSDYDVVTYDRRGYQQSRSLAPLDFELQFSDLGTVISSESHTAPVILFGHSYGGVIALAAAIAVPKLVSDCVVFETSLPWVHSRPGFSSYVAGDPGHEAELFFRRVVSDTAWERLSETEKIDRRSDGPALIADMTALRGQPPFRVSDIEVPVTYGFGDGAPSEYYSQVAQQLVADVAQLHIAKVANCGHGIHLSKPDHVVRLIRESLTRHLSQT